uniref:Uncharacterized protein n=1 Tax=Verrucosispora sp. MS100047 TaxID=1410949 RepID=A0A097CRN3_9ACTN|nr:hypothetical protein VASRM7_66 [Verrucosispora sp. MS100047]
MRRPDHADCAAVSYARVPRAFGQRDLVRAPRRLPNDSIVVAFFAGVVLAVRDRDAADWEAVLLRVAAFFVVVFCAGAVAPVALPAGAFFAVARVAVEVFLAGARVAVEVFLATAVAFLTAGAVFAALPVFGVVVFFAAVALAVGRRVGVAVAETAFLRAVRGVVGVGFPPGDFAAVAPVARFVAVATFFAATLAGGGTLRAVVCFLARPASAIRRSSGSAVDARSSRHQAGQTRP